MRINDLKGVIQTTVAACYSRLEKNPEKQNKMASVLKAAVSLVPLTPEQTKFMLEEQLKTCMHWAAQNEEMRAESTDKDVLEFIEMRDRNILAGLVTIKKQFDELEGGM